MQYSMQEVPHIAHQIILLFTQKTKNLWSIICIIIIPIKCNSGITEKLFTSTKSNQTNQKHQRKYSKFEILFIDGYMYVCMYGWGIIGDIVCEE